jgi:hypothetical protein
MIQVANKPFDEVEYKWLVCCVFGAWRQKYMKFNVVVLYEKNRSPNKE